MTSSIQRRSSPLGPVLTYEHEVDRPRLGLVMVLSNREYGLLDEAARAWGPVPWAWEDFALAQSVFPGARLSQVCDMQKIVAKRMRGMHNRGDFKKRAAYAPPPPEED